MSTQLSGTGTGSYRPSPRYRTISDGNDVDQSLFGSSGSSLSGKTGR